MPKCRLLTNRSDGASVGDIIWAEGRLYDNYIRRKVAEDVPDDEKLTFPPSLAGELSPPDAENFVTRSPVSILNRTADAPKAELGGPEGVDDDDSIHESDDSGTSKPAGKRGRGKRTNRPGGRKHE